MKILVTGATGFIGRKLVPKLAKKYEVCCFVRKTSDLETLQKEKVRLVFGDMLEKESVFKALKRIDIVIHLATSHMQGKERANLYGTMNIIEACKRQRVKKIIFISSMAAKRKILDDYGRTKLEIEKAIRESGLNYIILRPSLIYSHDNLSLIGKSLKALPFIIPIIGNGNYKMAPVFINDVVKAIANSIEKKVKNKSYDVAGAENLSFNEIISVCKKKFGINKSVIHVPVALCLILFRFFPIISLEAVKGINEDTNADISGLKEELKVQPISFKKGIENVNL